MPNASACLKQMVDAAHHYVPEVAKHCVSFWLEDKDCYQIAAK
jgi:hypothetical protein